ncbi:MAG: pyridoxamine 5'-phosphate oxidase family protein [Candidatus Thiodiazotropha taylori]
MGQRYTGRTDKLETFIEAQKLFFVCTAGAEGRVDVSPKGMDSLRVLGRSRVVWLNVTGSGNETSAHVQENPRMTLMFAVFEGEPMILRLYGEARVITNIEDSQIIDKILAILMKKGTVLPPPKLLPATRAYQIQSGLYNTGISHFATRYNKRRIGGLVVCLLNLTERLESLGRGCIQAKTL